MKRTGMSRQEGFTPEHPAEGGKSEYSFWELLYRVAAAPSWGKGEKESLA